MKVLHFTSVQFLILHLPDSAMYSLVSLFGILCEMLPQAHDENGAKDQGSSTTHGFDYVIEVEDEAAQC